MGKRKAKRPSAGGGSGSQRKETVLLGTPKLDPAEEAASEEAASEEAAAQEAASEEAAAAKVTPRRGKAGTVVLDAPDEEPDAPRSRKAQLPEPPSGRSGTVLMGTPGELEESPASSTAPAAVPSDPEPSDPEPSDPEPSDPEPSDPEPSDPEPSWAPGPQRGGASSSSRRAAPRRIHREPTLRESLIIARQKNRTTIAELSDLAERFTIHAERRLPIGRKVAIASAVSIALVMLVATALATGTWRWLLWTVAFAAIGALVTFGSVRLLKRYARQAGTRVLPGGPLVWLGALAATLLGVTAFLTWGLSEATASLAVTVFPNAPRPASAQEEPARVIDLDSLADKELKRGDGHFWVAGGVLHVPRTFHSEDGSFDLVMHFHGNTELVEESIAQAGINALVFIDNAGLGSGAYENKWSAPAIFGVTLQRIQEKAVTLGLQNARVRRIALISWSAGYGATTYIIRDPKAFEQIDAIVLLDSLHLGWVDENAGIVNQAALEPFVAFAKEAIAGRKLMLLTHSAIETHGYASTTKAANALLAAVDLERAEATGSPPPADFEEALRAVPKSMRRNLEVRSDVQKGSFRVTGYAGNTKEDHMAHLVQMATTVLPVLAERWKP